MSRNSSGESPVDISSFNACLWMPMKFLRFCTLVEVSFNHKKLTKRKN